MVFSQPIDIALDTGPGEIIEDRNPLASSEQPVGEIRPDEAGPAGNQHLPRH